MKNRLILLLGIALILLSGCGSSEIQGIVKDPFGNGLDGVTINIINSELKSSTDKNGGYVIKYVMGTFTVQYAKPGYTTQKINLNLQEKTRFPAQPVILYPIPTEAGIYYIGDKNLIKLPISEIVSQEIKEKSREALFGLGKSHIKYFPSKLIELSVKEGKAQFIDRISKPLASMRLSKDGFFVYLISVAGGIEFKVVYDGSVSGESNKIGEEKLLVRTMECKPGTYAFVEMFKNPLGVTLPKPKGNCFAFFVKTKDAADSLSQDGTAQAVAKAVKQVETQEATEQLFRAVNNANVDMAQRLLGQGADPNGLNESGDTGLILATRRKSLPLVRILLEKGADPNLRKNGDKTPLIIAAEEGNAEMVRILVDKGADPNLREKMFGMTALMFAADRGYSQIVQILLTKGANPNIRDNNGHTALMLVAPKGWLELTKILMNAGTDLSVRNYQDFDAGQLAARESHFQISDMLKAGRAIAPKKPITVSGKFNETQSSTKASSLNGFNVGNKWLIDWQSQFHYKGLLEIKKQLEANKYLSRIIIKYLNLKNVQITVSMDGILTIQGKNVVIRCSNPSVSWWDTDDFYLELNNDTMTGYNLDKKGRRGTAKFTFAYDSASKG